MTGVTIETVRGWLSTGFLATLVYLAAKMGKPVADYLIESHKIRAQEKKDDRQGYGDLIEALTKEVHDLRSENALLRREVRDLHSMVDGLLRGELQARQSAQVPELSSLPHSAVPPATADALRKLKGTEE